MINHNSFTPRQVIRTVLAAQSEPPTSEMTAMIKLMRLLGVATHNAKTIEQLFGSALSEICSYTDWPVGFAYIVEPPHRLQNFTAWYRSHPERYANLQAISARIDFSNKCSVIGKVLATRKAVYLADLNHHSFLRGWEALEAGLKSCIAVPVLVQHEPVAILELFHSESILPQDSVLESMEGIASYLGLVIEEKRVEKKLEALFDSAPDAQIVTDRSGVIVMANEQSVKLFGYPHEELIGQPIELLVPAERRAQHSNYRLNYTAAPHPRPMGSGMELAALRKDGTSIPVEISLSPVRVDEELLIASAIRDIRARKTLEEQLRERERLADMGTMAAVFAHEIASPLGGIFTTVEVIEMELPGELQPLIAGLKTEIRRLGSLLNEFRSVSRVGDLKPRVVNLADIVGRILEINAPAWSNAGVRIVTELSGNLTLTADGEKLQQMILNLARNAVEAMPNGGILSIKAYAPGHQVTLEIGDTGCGIAEVLEMFKPFSTSKSQGTGLGLYIVHQIVSAHHGAITYKTARGSGTTFEISLPKEPP